MRTTRYLRFLICTIVLSMLSLYAIPSGSTAAAAQAAAIKINKKLLTLEPGQSETLIVTGTTQKITWTTSKKEVAAVDKTGKVTANAEGTAIIKATVAKKKLTCSVTVKENPYIANAPFEAQAFEKNNFQYVIPKSWKTSDSNNKGSANSSGKKSEEGYSYITPASAVEGEESSSVELFIEDSDYSFDTSDYDTVKEVFGYLMTEDLITESFTQGLIDENLISKDTKVTYTDFTTGDYETPLGTAYKVEFNYTYNETEKAAAVYFLFVDRYYIGVAYEDNKENITPGTKEVCEYLLKSLHYINE